MTAVITFLKDWIKLIGEVFGKYPLAGALVTAAAVAVFYLLQKHHNPTGDSQKSVVNAFLTLLGWLIAVPILGVILNTVTFVGGTAFTATQFFYTKYDQQPIAVLILLALSLIGYVIWEWWFKPRQPVLRAAIAAGLFLVLVALVVPVINFFAPSQVPPRSENAVAPTGTSTPIPASRR